MRAILFTGLIMSAVFLLCSCTKSETILVPDNDPPIVNNVPAIKIENYVNRVFIDLLGREPLDSEMASEVQLLRDGELSLEVRVALIEKLQTGTDPIPGDSTYQIAYHQQIYNLAKVHFLEGVSDEVIQTEFLSNAQDTTEYINLVNVLDSRDAFREQSIDLPEFMGRMIYNNVYDQINMNTFNFVNATFDNLYWRYPTDVEFQAGFDMVEFESEENLLGQTGSNKGDYVDIVTSNPEFYEGVIIWVYQQLLSRLPTSAETAALLADFIDHKDIRLIQRSVMRTDEYAGF
ncbi:MAG: hypothetical protein GYB31_14315 [Bacteroidetes bacterium]|nr:hypothetical protein [Bacteroidota bacterium]